MRKWLAVGLALALLLAGGVASAHTHRAEDPDDSKGVFDLRRASFAHDDDSITLTFWTYEKFGAKPFHEGGYVLVSIQPRSSTPGPWVTIEFDHRKGRWIAEMTTIGGGETTFHPVSRPFPRIARVTIQRSALPSTLQAGVQWDVYSNANGEPGPDAPTDWMPNDTRAYYHDLTPD
jgi:hypothetical protein